ncbi:MAG TPA: energy transducer TonB [Gammaproteobacteria bacterium]
MGNQASPAGEKHASAVALAEGDISNSCNSQQLDIPLNIGISLRQVFASKTAHFSDQSAATFGLVVLLHATALCLMVRATDFTTPAVSVPMTISFAPIEPAQEKTRLKPKTEAPAEKPAVSATPAETQPQVIPPRFDVAHLNNPVPAYPALSQRLGEQGQVTLRVYVMPDGTAGEVQIHVSSGYPRLDRAAREAVERWKFMPASKNDHPVGAWVLIPIPYILKS